MSDVLSRIAHLSVLGILIGFAPAASAVSQFDANSAGPSVPVNGLMARATVQAAGETAAPAALEVWISEALLAHKKAQEAARVGKIVQAEAAKLKPGSYVWRPELATQGPVDVVVSLAAQRAYVYRGGKLIAVSSVSTGRKGHVTPVGSYPILQKKRMHHSNLYNNAPMPNMQRMTWDGVALHAGAIPGYPASHGCVRLPLEFSKLLFGITRHGSVVHVIAEEPTTSIAALDHALLQTARSGIFGPRKAAAARPRKPAEA